MAGSGFSSIIDLLAGLGLSIGTMSPAGLPLAAQGVTGLASKPNMPAQPSPMGQRPSPAPMSLPSLSGAPTSSGPTPLPTVGSPTAGGLGGASGGNPSMAALIQSLMKLKGGMGGG